MAGVLGLIWPVWATLGALAVLRFVFGVQRSLRLGRAGLNEIDRMSQNEFEARLEDMFFGLGYAVELAGPPDDCCIIITRNGARTAVHAELMDAENVPSPAIDEVLDAKVKYGCDEAMIVRPRTGRRTVRRGSRRHAATRCMTSFAPAAGQV
jgi:hypothetical protein